MHLKNINYNSIIIFVRFEKNILLKIPTMVISLYILIASFYFQVVRRRLQTMVEIKENQTMEGDDEKDFVDLSKTKSLRDVTISVRRFQGKRF